MALSILCQPYDKSRPIELWQFLVHQPYFVILTDFTGLSFILRLYPITPFFQGRIDDPPHYRAWYAH